MILIPCAHLGQRSIPSRLRRAGSIPVLSATHGRYEWLNRLQSIQNNTLRLGQETCNVGSSNSDLSIEAAKYATDSASRTVELSDFTDLLSM